MKKKRKSIAVCERASGPTLHDAAQDDGESEENQECIGDPKSQEDTGEECESAECADAVEEDGEMQGGEGEKSKNSHRIQGLYKPPTHDELQTLKETQNLFKSNLMKLQVYHAILVQYYARPCLCYANVMLMLCYALLC